MSEFTLENVKVVEDKLIGRDPRNQRSFYKNSQIHVFIKGESIMENLQNRRQRPYTLYRKLITELSPELKGKLRWSQKAGCPCGCSPGFIVDQYFRTDDARKLIADRYITLEM